MYKVNIMELIKFRIRNYKSIVDSGDCYFSDDKLTIFAGKNECGKTSILEALEDFNKDKVIREEAKPISTEELSEISVSFKLSTEEIKFIFEKINAQYYIKGKQDVEITLIKKSDNSESPYSLDDKTYGNLHIINKNNMLQAIIDKHNDLQEEIIEVGLKEKFSITIDENNFAPSMYTVEIDKFRNENEDQISDSIAKKIVYIQKAIDIYYSSAPDDENFIQYFVDNILPNFILFSSFDDKFPQSIPIASLMTNEWAQDLECVSSFSIAKITSTNKQEQAIHENLVNIDFSSKFQQFWTQDEITLQIKSDTQDVNFWIIENDISYYPSQRSKGQQWYLAFYVKIVAKLQEDKSNIILIDEPGLYLHAKAQKDLLKVLLNHTDNNHVIFSTHSPYLITEDNLENIRLVEKTATGTIILGKIHSHPTADKETLTPILTAIGLGVNDSITNLNQKDNVVVEGVEDVFYLQAFKILEGNGLETNFINGGGAPNMGFIGAILEGWGANVYYLYDNDQGKKDGVKRLKKGWKVLPDLIKTVCLSENASIVDIFSDIDFKTFVLEDPNLTYELSNSAYLKINNASKVLLARKFLQKAKKGDIQLNTITKNNINMLFKEIKFKQESEPPSK